MRIHLSSVLILVALVAVGLWVAITATRICAAMVALSSESIVVVHPAYLIMALVAALLMIAVGVVSFVVRLWAIIRNKSQRSGLGRPNW